jgi:hypothetical protein
VIIAGLTVEGHFSCSVSTVLQPGKKKKKKKNKLSVFFEEYFSNTARSAKELQTIEFGHAVRR